MPSPIGHAIAGVAIAWAAFPQSEESAPLRENPHWRAACYAAIAAAPDLDLLIPHSHRTVTHSVGALAVLTIVTIAVTGKVTSRRWTVVAAVVAAYASHLLLDWLAADATAPRGLRLLWPLTDHWYISELDLFRGTARIRIFTAASMWTNLTAIAQEVVILGPIAWTIRLIRGTGLEVMRH